MNVKNFMIRDLTSVTEDTNLIDVAKILASHSVSGVPVVDLEHHVIGFISESDIIQSAFPGRFGQRDEFVIHNYAQLYSQLSSVGQKLVKDFMSRDVVVVNEDMDEEEVAELMLNRNYKILPVVRDNRLVGVINRAQLCRVLMEKTDAKE